MSRTLTAVLTATIVAAGGLVTPAVAGATVRPQQVVCSDGKSYKITSHTADYLVQLGNPVQLHNKGNTTSTLSTGVTITGSVSTSLSVTAGVDASVVVATVKASVTATATYTLSGSWTVSASMVVRPGKTGVITGGIFRMKTVGTYEHVSTSCADYKTTVTAYTPYRYGYETSGG